MISDLGGKRRVEYKNETGLSRALHRFAADHDYTKRFEKALVQAGRGVAKGPKKRLRALSLKLVHALDGVSAIRRLELVQRLQAMDYREVEIDGLIKKLHAGGVIRCAKGRYSVVRVA